MPSVLRSDIPESRRYDMTLDAAGENSKGHTVARFIVDNGEYRGKRLTRRLSPVVVAELRRASSHGVTRENIQQFEKKLRVSAEVKTMGSYLMHGMWMEFNPDEEEPPMDAEREEYRYLLLDFQEPEAPSELDTVFNRQEKFVRS